jgi:hypothetical protein
VEFSIREITQGSKKKTYGPYSGYIEKLKEPIELKGRVIKYKPVAKLSGKKGVMKGGYHYGELKPEDFLVDFSKKSNISGNPTYKYDSSFFGKDKLFFGPIFSFIGKNGKTIQQYFPYVLFSDSWTYELYIEDNKLEIKEGYFSKLKDNMYLPKANEKEFSKNMNKYLKEIHDNRARIEYHKKFLKF